MALGGFFEQHGATPGQRRALFYGVCIWVRLLIAVAAYYALKWWPVPAASVILALAVAVVAVNATAAARHDHNDVWWSRGAHAVIAAMVAVMAVAALATRGKQVPYTAVALAVGLDVVFGVVYSFTVDAF
jgi:uncharacterized membrane protein YgdD (TMEM256/DUF423 family)